MHNVKGMKKLAGSTIAALLIFGAVAAALVIPQTAYAAVTITSSTDVFFGPSLVRFLITDTALVGTPTDTINVLVEAKRGGTTLGSVSASTVSEIGSSGTFELFVTTSNDGLQPAAPTFTTTSGHTVRINTAPTGDANDFTIDLNGGAPANPSAELRSGDSIVVTYGGQSKTVSFQRTTATLTADRSTAGNGNEIVLALNDRDANIDPTAVDSFPADTVGLLAGTGLTTTGTTFVETGQNTGIFELTVNVNTPATDAFVTRTLPVGQTFTVTDHDVYANAIGGAGGAVAPFDAITARTSTASASVTLQNNDGIISIAKPVSFANGISLRIADGDRNISTTTEDTFTGEVTVAVEGVVTTFSVPMTETGLNTGIFEPDLTDAMVPIAFGATTSVSPAGIVLSPADVAADLDLTISYADPQRDPTGAATFSLIRTLQHTPGALTATPTVDVNGRFEMSITDPDLNTNTQTAETYTAIFPAGAGGSAAVALNGITGMNTLGFTLDNAAFTLPAGGLTVTFIETGPNTGIFTATNVDMGILGGAITLEDGDQIKATYTDNMEDPSQDSDFTITIGKPSETIELEKTTLPIPLTGDSVKVGLTVIDPTANINNASTDVITLTAVTIQDKNGAAPGTAVLTVSPGPVTLTETGVNTGVFTRTVTITGTTGNAANNDGAKIVFDYNGKKASAVLKSFDLTITTSASSVGGGDTLIVTITDADRNLDPSIVDKVSFTIQGVDDDQTLSNQTADETGPNTGVFRKSLVVGTDFKISTIGVSSASMATTIKIKAIDAIASDLQLNVERERNIGITTGTGVISVEPGNPGPGTKVIVRIVDNDLNTSPTGVQTIQASTGLLKIVTDRTGVSITNLGMKETGPNTGIFEHEITFTPLVGTPSITVNVDKSTVEVLPGDIVSLRYTDEVNSSGSKVTVSATFTIISQDPMMTSTATSVKVGDGFPLTVTDSDANKDGDITDTISLRITSNSDAVGFTTTFVETGPNTGVFTGTIQTTDSVEAGSVTVKVGDNVSVKYNDLYPANYADRVKLVVDPSQDFFFNMPVGVGPGDVTSTTPTSPALTDLSGRAITSVAADQQVVINSTVRNNEQGARAMATIVEVRDASGFTQYLQWQTGTIPGNGEVNAGFSWTPDASGTYQIRVFVITSITNPAALSSIVTSSVTVN